jgi:LCP family protein required for cell wall assembly
LEQDMAEKRFNTKSKAFPHIKIGQIILLVVGLALAVGLFIFLQGFVACWRLTSLPGMSPANCKTLAANNPQSTPQPGSEGTPGPIDLLSTPPVSAPALELPPPWDGASRVTVLVIGLDYRDWLVGEGAPRSDTMILLTIDPVSKTAGMMTVPRDLWVNIPGFGYGKINTAYSLGAGNNLPGGGPGLAMKTVENVIGVPINYFAQVDFSTFEAFVNAIGGVKVDVTEAIELTPVGTRDHTILQPGRYTLDGPLALAYARNRYNTGDDMDRSRRQMQIIMGIRERVTNPTYWPTLAANAYPLYEKLSAGITTDITFDDAFRLGLLAREIPKENIQQGSINYTMVEPAKSPDGLDILVVYSPEKIRELRDQIFSPGGMLSPMAQGDPVALMQAEGARVSVLNASGVNGLAGKTGDYLKGQGMNVVNVGNPSEFPGTTVLIDHSGKPYTLKYLMQLMNVSSAQIRIRFDPNAAADIEILLGSDWANNNPMP